MTLHDWPSENSADTAVDSIQTHLPNQKLGRSFLFGPTIVTVVAFMAGIAYAVYQFYTDKGLDLLIITLPIFPFVFALPNLVLSLLVFRFIHPGAFYIPVLVLLVLLALATPLLYSGITSYSVNAGHKKEAEKYQILVNAQPIRACITSSNLDAWSDCVKTKVLTPTDVEICISQSIRYYNLHDPSELKSICQSAYDIKK